MVPFSFSATLLLLEFYLRSLYHSIYGQQSTLTLLSEYFSPPIYIVLHLCTKI